MRRWGAVLLAVVSSACSNDPWPSGAASENTLYVSFDQRSPRHLDPTASFAANENPYTYSIHEPLYQVHYLKRPYQLVPRAAAAVVQPRYLDSRRPAAARRRAGRAHRAELYDIPIRPGMRWAPHPAFALDAVWPPPIPRADARPGARQGHTLGLRRHRHARGDGRGLRLRLQAPRQPAAGDAGAVGVRRLPAVGLKDYVALLKAGRRVADGRSAAGVAGQALPGPAALAAAGRAGAGPAHAAAERQGQGPAVELVAGADLRRAGAVGGRRLLRPARHARAGPVAGPLAGRQRPLLHGRLSERPPPRDAPQPAVPRRDLPLRRRAGRCRGRAAAGLRQAAALHRPRGGGDDRRARAAQAAVPARPPGPARGRAQRLGRGIPRRHGTLGRGAPAADGARPALSAGGRRPELVRGLQLAGPGGRPRRHPRSRIATAAAPGAVDRHRLGRGLRPHLRPRGRIGRTRTGAAGQLRLARRAARLAQPGDAPAARRPGAAPPAGRGKGA
jgi:hypothetical protein